MFFFFNLRPLFDSSKEPFNDQLCDLNQTNPFNAPKIENIINLDCFSENQSSPEEKSEKSNFLLNLGPRNSELSEDIFSSKISPDVDLLSNDLDEKLIADDLLGFNSPINDIEQKVLSSSNINSIDPTFCKSEGNASNQKSTNNLQRNTSTPNLTKFDPFGDLGDLLNFSNSTNAKTNTSIPRVSSYNTFPNESKNPKTNVKNVSKEQKPDYSRINFNNVAPSTGIKAPRVNGNEFEDLLGGFKKTQTDTNPKSIAQLRKEDLVCI